MVIAIVLAAMMVQAISERPLRPADKVLLDAVRARDPSIEILDHAARDARDGARVICGRIRIKGQIEPFHALTLWDRSGAVANVIVNAETGRPAGHVEPDHWKVSAVLPERRDEDGDGVQTRAERNADALDRKLTLQVCRDLTPPPGTLWATELERRQPAN